ncbi:Hypothetical predicted protein [Mytilus galloprovincialis]|uniref:Uncharacterized protein n=1 Tax=Mytilus galloprovincialis TaxID=29158 RepID=A0A8B6DL86_MYTGA|nr:Hypothetical predicted protein [Mytilus galloprovincialis]
MDCAKGKSLQKPQKATMALEANRQMERKTGILVICPKQKVVSTILIKETNLQRHAKNKPVDTKQKEDKSKDLVDTSDNNESEEWERQDPGDVIKTASGTDSKEFEQRKTEKDDTKVTPGKESSESKKTISYDSTKAT